MSRCLGRKPRVFGPVPHVDMLRSLTYQPVIPAAKNWLEGMPTDLGYMLNQTLGNCTCAALGHSVQVWTHAAKGAMETLPDADILKLYEGACGYVDGDPSTDNGGIEQHVLAYAMNTGIPTVSGTDKLIAFAEIDPRKSADIKHAIAEGGVVYLGINIPEAWAQSQPGDVWDVTDSPVAGGHAIIGAGYDNIGLYIVSWGMIFCMTWAGFAQAVDEAYLLCSNDWFTAKGATPFGMTLAELEGAMHALKE